MRKKIQNLLKEGKKIETKLFNLYFKNREDLKIGFIGTSKIGKPVKRNKAKRYLREIIRKNFKKGDFLFVLKKEIIDKNFEDIERVFKEIKNEITEMPY
ncbi:MAG: ribonuclease P protein component [Candidatus Omnitrophica bacterium]|nr:ribonuclease P protein component [Candidatus Omnitrophota bacterium]